MVGILEVAGESGGAIQTGNIICVYLLDLRFLRPCGSVFICVICGQLWVGGSMIGRVR